MNHRNRIIPYLSPPMKPRPQPRTLPALQFGPATGLIISTVAVVASISLGARHDDLLAHGVAAFLMAAACAASAAGCVVGFGNHDNGYLPVRKQIFGGVVGLIDLVMAFVTIILFAAMLKP